MNQSVATPQDKLNFLREKLEDVYLSARKDLSVSRHVFRGQPSYIVHDPVSMNSHRFSKHDYQTLAALTRNENLAKTFQRLSNRGHLSKTDETAFYEFILTLQTRGLLNLPVTDSKQLYQRHRNTESMKSKNLVGKLLFLKIPLFNPNDFLDRTMFLAKPLFTKAFLVFWMLLMIGSAGILIYRGGDFFMPMSDLLATRNLPIFVVVLTALKFWHELGHAYACKIRGGVVPDMGAFFMVGMPMAYVDVSSSWSFPSRRNRMLVGLGGIYFESIAAAFAVIVWALTSDGLVRSTAHFTVLMASFMTLLFNANPLMKYDGYYILSDVLGIPNLRQRSTKYLKDQFKRIGLGIPTTFSATKSENMILATYGIASSIYQIVLVLSISLMLATQYFIVGVALASSFAMTSIAIPFVKFMKYLFIGKETQKVRGRARAWGGGIAIGAITAFFLVPMPGGNVLQGQLGFESTQIVRLPVTCQIEEVLVEPNQSVRRDEPVIQLSNDRVQHQYQLASAKFDHAESALLACATVSACSKKQMYFELETKKQELLSAKSLFSMLTVTSELDGRVLSCPRPNAKGKFYDVGEEILRIGSGRHVIRALLNSEQMTVSDPSVGQQVNFRLYSDSSKELQASITRVEPAGSKKIAMTGLTHLANGNIIVDPANNEALQPYFLIEMSLNEPLKEKFPDKTTVSVRLGRSHETLGMFFIRRAKILAHQLSVGE